MKSEVLPGWSQSWDSTKLFQLPFSKMLQVGNVCVHAVPWIKVGMHSAQEGSEMIWPSGPVPCSVFGGARRRAHGRKAVTGVVCPVLLPGPFLLSPWSYPPLHPVCLDASLAWATHHRSKGRVSLCPQMFLLLNGCVCSEHSVISQTEHL